MEEINTVQLVEQPHTFIIGDAINTGWKLTKKYFGIVLLLLLAVIAPSIIQTIIEALVRMVPGSTMLIQGRPEFVGWWAIIMTLFTLVIQAVSVWISIGYIKSNLLLLEDQKPSVETFTSVGRLQVARMIGSVILSTLATTIGLILLVIPGIYVMIRLSMAQYYIAEGYGVIDSLKASWAATKGNIWKLIGFALVNIGVMLLGAIALLVGLLWAIPTISLAQVYVYKALKPNTPTEIKPLTA